MPKSVIAEVVSAVHSDLPHAHADAIPLRA